jgi:hypothetical protein
MAIKRCPYCQTEVDDGKTSRFALYVRDQRITIFPDGINYRDIAPIARNTPDSYLVLEILDKDGRILAIRNYVKSTFVEVNGRFVKRT